MHHCCRQSSILVSLSNDYCNCPEMGLFRACRRVDSQTASTRRRRGKTTRQCNSGSLCQYYAHSLRKSIMVTLQLIRCIVINYQLAV